MTALKAIIGNCGSSRTPTLIGWGVKDRLLAKYASLSDRRALAGRGRW